MAVTAEQMSGSRTVAAAKRAVLKPTRAAKPLQLEQIDQLLGAIYDGATESPPWQTAMARLREVLAAAHVTLMLRPPSSDSAGVMINTGPTTAQNVESYETHFFAAAPFVRLARKSVVWGKRVL